MPRCTADVAGAGGSARNAFVGCKGEMVLTFALSLDSRTDDQGFPIRIFGTRGAETWTHIVSPSTIIASSCAEAMTSGRTQRTRHCL